MIFKGTKILYFGAVALLLAIVTYLQFDDIETAVCTALFCFAFIMLTASVFYQRYKIKRIQELLDEKCDPQKFRSVMEELLDQPEIKKNEMLYDRLRLNLITALLESGEVKKALAMLEEMADKVEASSDPINKALCYSNLAGAYLETDDIQNAKKYTQLLGGVLKQFKAGSGKYRLIEPHYTVKQTLLDIASGNFDSAESVFLSMFKKAKNKRTRVAAKYQLGKIYYRFKAWDQAEEAFDYAIINGNRLHIASLSRKYLANIRRK